MTENSGLSLRHKLLFEANHKTYVIRFLATLEIQQGISEEEALACLRVLVDFGLPLYDPAKMWTDEFRLSKQLADRAIAAKLTNLLQPHEMSMAQIQDLSFLLIDRDELFEIFNRKGFNKPYPWPHTLPEWLNPNPDEKEEIPAASLTEGKEAPVIPNREAQLTNLLTADQQRLPDDNKAVDNLPPRAQSTLLKMLDVALSQQYGQDWLDGDIDTLAVQWIKDLEPQGISIPAEDRAMKKWLSRIAKKRNS